MDCFSPTLTFACDRRTGVALREAVFATRRLRLLSARKQQEFVRLGMADAFSLDRGCSRPTKLATSLFMSVQALTLRLAGECLRHIQLTGALPMGLRINVGDGGDHRFRRELRRIPGTSIAPDGCRRPDNVVSQSRTASRIACANRFCGCT